MKGANTKKAFSREQHDELLAASKARLEKMNRHADLEWAKVKSRVESQSR